MPISRAADRARQQARREAGPPADAPHGTYSCYINYRCRCELCRLAQQQYSATVAIRRRVAGVTTRGTARRPTAREQDNRPWTVNEDQLLTLVPLRPADLTGRRELLARLSAEIGRSPAAILRRRQRAAAATIDS